MTPAQRDQLRARIIETITDEQLLEARIRRILGKMALLAEGATMRLGDKTRSGKAGSAHLIGRANDSLFYIYTKRFADVQGYERRLTLCYCAERDYRDYTKPARRATEDKSARDRRILEDYAGFPAVEAAVLERVSHSHIRHLRKSEGLEPESGLEREPQAA